MRTIALLESGELQLQTDASSVEMQSGMVKVQVKACGICGSDLALMNGTRDRSRERYFGHEFSGIVVETAPDWPVNYPERAADAGTAGTVCRIIAEV